MNYPEFNNPFYAHQARLLCFSYKRWTGNQLIPEAETTDNLIKALFDAPFILVAHGAESVSIFNFGSRAALELFEIEWNEFIRLPSRKSADEDNREDRERLMSRVKTNGYATDCKGVRITSTGRRFFITGATVWNVVDELGDYHGQAAMFTDWSYLVPGVGAKAPIT